MDNRILVVVAMLQPIPILVFLIYGLSLCIGLNLETGLSLYTSVECISKNEMQKLKFTFLFLFLCVGIEHRIHTFYKRI